jgi:hypothetical protein
LNWGACCQYTIGKIEAGVRRPFTDNNVHRFSNEDLMSNLAGRSASFYNKSLIMGTLMEKLSKLESQLQALIEQGASRIVASGEQQNQISSSLVEAMQGSVKLDQEGRAIAADTYIIIVNNDAAQILTEDPSINEALIQILVQSGEQSGINFQAQPRIKISIDDSKGSSGFKILPDFGIQDIAETSTMTVDPGDGMTLPEHAFLIIHGNQVFPLTEQVLNLGRRSDNQIVIDNPRISRRHAQLRVINNRYVIFDLESTGGTFVNKVRVEQASLLPGDVISLAGIDLVYGQDAGLFSGDSGGSTQPLMPFPNAEK